jgi:hypothetical protein
MSVSVDLFLFFYFRNDLEYQCVPISQEVFVGNDQTITNDIRSVSLKLSLPQVCHVHIIFYSIGHIRRDRIRNDDVHDKFGVAQFKRTWSNIGFDGLVISNEGLLRR